MRRALAILALTAALLCVLCASAFADGDPASDVLLDNQVFVALLSGSMPPAQVQLSNVVATANKARFPIRVAVISSEYDLGSVSALWKKPQTYAHFLGIELSLAYKGLLLVVMPNGFGVNWPGHSSAAASAALAHLKVPSGELGAVNGAQVAVRKLASAAGVSLSSSASKPSTAVRSHSMAHAKGPGISAVTVILIIAAAALLVALGANLLLLLRRRRAMGSKRAPPGLAVLFAVGMAVPIVAVGALLIGKPRASPKATSQTGVHTAADEASTSWPQGQRPAPDFTLTNQSGQRVSPASYRGRPVIITFIDPLCRNLCPLEAKVLNEADERLPASKRPQIIAVSVDIYADTHADLMLDFRRWSLVPQWQWAVGTPAQLNAVWKHYYAEVEVQTKHIAGTTVHYVTHSEMAYIVDGKGYERALLSWPYSAKAVESELLKIEHA